MSSSIEKYSRFLKDSDILEMLEVLCSLACNAHRPGVLRHVVLCANRLLSVPTHVDVDGIDVVFVKLATLIEKFGVYLKMTLIHNIVYTFFYI